MRDKTYDVIVDQESSCTNLGRLSRLNCEHHATTNTKHTVHAAAHFLHLAAEVGAPLTGHLLPQWWQQAPAASPKHYMVYYKHTNTC